MKSFEFAVFVLLAMFQLIPLTASAASDSEIRGQIFALSTLYDYFGNRERPSGIDLSALQKEHRNELLKVRSEIFPDYNGHVDSRMSPLESQLMAKYNMLVAKAESSSLFVEGSGTTVQHLNIISAKDAKEVMIWGGNLVAQKATFIAAIDEAFAKKEWPENAKHDFRETFHEHADKPYGMGFSLNQYETEGFIQLINRLAPTELNKLDLMEMSKIDEISNANQIRFLKIGLASKRGSVLEIVQDLPDLVKFRIDRGDVQGDLASVNQLIENTTKITDIFNLGDYIALSQAARTEGLLPEPYLGKMKAVVTAQLKRVRNNLIDLKLKDEASGIVSEGTSASIVKYNLLVLRIASSGVFKLDMLESRFYNLLSNEVGESLLLEQGVGELNALRKTLIAKTSFAQFGLSNVSTIYAAAGWEAAAEYGISVNNPLSKTINAFSNFSQVRFFREMLKQRYSTPDIRMKKVLKLTAGNDRPALMLSILGAHKIKIEAGARYHSYFNDLLSLYDDSQIEMGNSYLFSGHNLSAVTEAAIYVNAKACNVGMHRNPWL